MPTAVSADGVRHQFPEGIDPSAMDRAMKTYAAQKGPTAAESLPEPSPKESPAAGIWQKLVTPVAKAAGGMATAMWDNLLAGSQGVKTYASSEGAALAPQAEQFKFSEAGKVSDPSQFFAGREPKTGKMAVYQRSPDTAAGLGERVAQAGRGMALAQPERFPMVSEAPVRGGMRTPEPSPAQRLAQDFAAAKVPPSVPAVGQGRAAGLAAQLGRNLPGSPVAPAMQRSLEGTGQAAEQAAAGFGAAQTPADAGSVVRNAARRFAADRSAGNANYSEFFRLMHGAQPAPMTSSLTLLRDLKGRFPNAPGLQGVFTNSKLSRLAEELEPRTRTIPPETSPVLDASGQPIVTAPARTVTTGGVLSVPELKELRSQIGYLLEEPAFGPEAIPKAQLRRVYSALTSDMRAAATRQGPAAVQALARANTDYGTRMRLIERLEPLLKPDAPERSYASLNSAATGGDAGLLQAAKTAMRPDEWGDVGAATIRKLGVPTPGAKDILGDNFSLSSYATNWNKLSGRAKDLLFGPDTPGSPRAGLETLSRVVGAQKNVGRLANVSHSGEMATMAGIVADISAEIAMGRLPWAAAVGLTGSYGVSKALSSPGFARWLYQLPKTVKNAPTRGAATAQAARSLELYLTNPTMAQSPMPEPKRPIKTGDAGPMGGVVTGVDRAGLSAQ